MKTYSPIFFILSFLISSPCLADVKFNASVKLMPSTWTGSNERINERDYSSNATQLSLGLGLQDERWYASLAIQGKTFNFDRPAPDIIDAETRRSVENVSIEHSEADLVVGYYFWPQVSLFADYKNITNQWQGENHSIKYGGLGLGVSGFLPISPDWILFASLGFVPMRIHMDSDPIGHGVGTAIEFGGGYKFNKGTRLLLGVKSHSQELKFDIGEKQTHRRGGLFFGITQQF